MVSFKIISCITAMISSVIMLQTLYFNFTVTPESVFIFTQLGLERNGRIGVGVVELMASILLIIPKSRFIGVMGIGLMLGAVMRHLTKLDIDVINDGAFCLHFVLLF